MLQNSASTKNLILRKESTMKFKVMTTIFALVLVAGSVALTLSLISGAASVSASSERNGDLHVTKNCSASTNDAGSFCTITSSNLAEIKVGSKVFYTQAAVGCDTGGTTYPCPAPLQTPEGGYISLDSNVVLYVGTGDWAVGRCTLDGTGNSGLCTFSDGIGQFSGFHARVNVSTSDPNFINYNWDGTYSFSPQPDGDR
jgi:hypothetical protein